jgi:hypothetical protein
VLTWCHHVRFFPKRGEMKTTRLGCRFVEVIPNFPEPCRYVLKLVERALKKAVLHRKNSLFYKTENGARIGDLFMGLIHTCELSGANPFDYLTQLQLHTGELARSPSAWDAVELSSHAGVIRRPTRFRLE